MGNRMTSLPFMSPISTDSEYDTQSSSQNEGSIPGLRVPGLRADPRVKLTTDERVADRRRRNGESAKRSRQKRKKFLAEMETNYEKLTDTNTRLEARTLYLQSSDTYY